MFGFLASRAKRTMSRPSPSMYSGVHAGSSGGTYACSLFRLDPWWRMIVELNRSRMPAPSRLRFASFSKSRMCLRVMLIASRQVSRKNSRSASRAKRSHRPGSTRHNWRISLTDVFRFRATDSQLHPSARSSAAWKTGSSRMSGPSRGDMACLQSGNAIICTELFTKNGMKSMFTWTEFENYVHLHARHRFVAVK